MFSGAGKLRARVSTWATRSLKYKGRPLLVTTSGRPGHAMVIEYGIIYDNHAAAGLGPDRHPFRNAMVDYVALVERRP